MTTSTFAIDQTFGTARTWRLRTATAAAIVLADVANSAAYLAGASAGLFPQDVLIPGLGSPVTIARVLVSTTVGVGLGAVGFALLRRFSRRPYRTFRIVAVVLLLASYSQPGMVLHAPIRMVLALNVLHTIAAAVVLWAMRRSANECMR